MNILAVIGAFVIVLPLAIGMALLTLIWRTWWLYPAWGWFIVPLGVRPITFWHFAALIFLGHVLTLQTDTKKDDRETDWTKLASGFIWPVFVWVMLWWLAR